MQSRYSNLKVNPDDDELEAWTTVLRGLRPALVGLAIWFAALLCGLYARLLLGADSQGSFPDLLAKVLTLADEVPSCIGYYYLLSAPPRHQARVFAVAALVFAGCSAIAQLAWTGGAPQARPIAELLSYARMVAFLLFLHATTVRTIGDRKLVASIWCLTFVTLYLTVIEIVDHWGSLGRLAAERMHCNAWPFRFAAVAWAAGVVHLAESIVRQHLVRLRRNRDDSAPGRVRR